MIFLLNCKILLLKKCFSLQCKRETNARRLGEWSTVGVFRGKNMMGKILMACRKALHTVVPPTIDIDCLKAAVWQAFIIQNCDQEVQKLSNTQSLTK